MRSFRGTAKRVRLLVPGGTVGQLSQVVPGAPTFQTGMQSLYFLEPLPSGTGFGLVGFNHGVVTRIQNQRFDRLLGRVGALTPSDTPSVLERPR